jgi:hypothetical protein
MLAHVWADSDLIRRQLVRGHLSGLCLLGEASPKTCGKETLLASPCCRRISGSLREFIRACVAIGC